MVYDVVIVGAGLGGLWCGYQLKYKHNIENILILEARDRVGGRTCAKPVPNEVFQQLDIPVPQKEVLVDVGGQWVGPQQVRVNQLIQQLNLKTIPQYYQGKTVVDLKGNKQALEEDATVYPPAFIQCGQLLDQLASTVDPAKPWTSPNAKELDSINVSTWIKQQPFSKPEQNGYVYDHMELRGILASEPSDISLLYWLSIIAKGVDGRVTGPSQPKGCLAHLADTVSGAQQDKLPGSAWNISQQVYLQYLRDKVQFQSPVTNIIQQQAGGVLQLQTAQGSFVAKQVVIAVPPVVCEKILFNPPLPAPRAHLQQRMFMGSVIKILLFYRTPFWKHKSLSGLSISDNLQDFSVQLTYDASVEYPENSGKFLPAVVAFLLGNAARLSSASETSKQREIRADQFVRYLFDTPASSETELLASVENDWCAEPWSGGGYAGVTGCGTLSQYGEYLVAPLYENRLFWCGTESAFEWSGYLEGAMESAERAASTVAALNATSKL